MSFRFLAPLFVFIPIVFVGCSTPGTTHSRLSTGSGTIYEGMEASKVTDKLGAPDEVNEGYNIKYDTYVSPLGATPKDGAIEWVWYGSPVIVVYQKRMVGKVDLIGTIPRGKLD